MIRTAAASAPPDEWRANDQDHVLTVLARWPILVLCCLSATVLGFTVAQSAPRQYTAEARVLVGSVTDPSYDLLLAYQQLARTYAELAVTGPVLSQAVREMGIVDEGASLAQRVEAREMTGQPMVLITAHGPTATEAAGLANAVAAEVTILAKPRDGASSLASVVQPALPPAHPSSPLVLLDTLVAAALGLGLGAGLALGAGDWWHTWRPKRAAARAWPDREHVPPCPPLVPVRRVPAEVLAAASSGDPGDRERPVAGTPSPAAGGAADEGERRRSPRRRGSTVAADPLQADASDARIALAGILHDLETGRLERGE